MSALKQHILAMSTSFRDLSVTDINDRGHWGSKAEFLLSCIGLSVGLGNVWRFPVLAYENGGAAFFIPYIILQLLIGKPMYFMELALGQYCAQGPVGVWELNPSSKGIGISMALISLVTTIFYNVVMAYTVYYTVATFQKKLPWTWCRKEWIKKNCWVRVGQGASMPKCSNKTMLDVSTMCKCVGKVDYDFNLSSPCYTNQTNYGQLLELAKTSTCQNLSRCTNNTRSPADFYFYDSVIQRSSGLSHMGSPIWYLVLCLLFSWTVVVLCLMKGIKSSGKVVYFTATFPYIILIVLLIGGLTQTGSLQGVLYFLSPSLDKLLHIEVWKNAAGQMFFSLSISFGAIIMFGSYNTFHNNVYTDALIISCTDIVTSFISGLVVFSTLGAMSHESGIPIDDVASKGYGLAFVAYPEALSRLPVPHMWSILFFFMMFTLGLDSEFAFLETVLTCLQDEIPQLRQRKMSLCLTSGFVCFIIALCLVTNGGDYVLQLMDSYGATYPVIFVAFCELVSVNWVYGVRRFTGDIKQMLGYSPHPTYYWEFCWAIAAPVLIAVIFLYYLSVHKPTKYPDGTPIEPWAHAIGWLIFLIIILPVPVWFVISIYRVENEPNIIKRVKKAMSPSSAWHRQRDVEHTNGRLLTLLPLTQSLSTSKSYSKQACFSGQDDTDVDISRQVINENVNNEEEINKNKDGSTVVNNTLPP